MYRDELIRAGQRIEELQAQLDAQNAELVGLRQQVAKRVGATSPWRRPRRRRLAFLGVALVAVTGTWLTFRDSRPAAAPPAMGMVPVGPRVDALDLPAPAPPATGGPVAARPSSAARRRGTSSDPGFRLQLADQARVSRLASRCERSASRTSLDDLPRGTRVMDFMTCAGCACCVDGAFPPTFDERASFRSESGVCRGCSRDWTLADAKIAVAGGTDDEPLRGSYGLVFTLGRPARLFALRVDSGSFHVTNHPLPDLAVSLVAYDVDGRPIDGARATYPASAPDSSKTDFSVLPRVLVVEACPGEEIGRVDLATESSLSVKAIATLPAEGR